MRDFLALGAANPGLLLGNAAAGGGEGGRGEEGGLLDGRGSALPLLYTFGARGVLVKVRRSHAATVNPWLLIVEPVAGGARLCSARDALAALDAGLDLAAGLAPEEAGRAPGDGNQEDADEEDDIGRSGPEFGVVPGCEDCVVVAGP